VSPAGPDPGRSGTGPLTDIRVAVTRPLDRAHGLTAPLEAAGATTRCFPLIRIVGPGDPRPLVEAVARLGAYDWAVFTSANAVASLLAASGGTGLPAGPRPRLAAVGPATGGALQAAGRAPDLIAEERVAEGLAEALIATGTLAGGRVLWPRAAGARLALADALRAAGALVDAPEAYASEPDTDQAGQLATAVGRGEIDVLTFTSPSAVRSYVRAGGSIPDGVRVAAIGPITAAAAGAEGFAVHILPEDASAELLAEAIVQAFGKRS
jgi:uroporphyrinogen-III synthase